MSLAFSAAASYRRTTALVGLIGSGLLVFGFLINRQQFFLSYLQGYLFAVAIPLGCLGLTMVHTLSGGRWGWTIRPFLEAGIKTLPAMAILFIPVVLGMNVIYPWTNTELVHHDAALASKAVYLNSQFWLIRAGVYFLIWIVLGWWLLRWLQPSPTAGTLSQQHRVQRVAAGGLLIFVLSASFAAIDWVMSIEPHWFSSIFGVIVLVGAAMSAFSVCTISLVLMHRHTPNPWMTDKNLHDLGKFLFMTVMLWGYMSVSQFLIIWAGNLPEETFWYYERSIGGWRIVSTILPIVQFVIPFCILLSARVKKNPKQLVMICLFLLAVRAFEQVWLVAPGVRAGTLVFQWMDIAAPLALGGLWGALYLSYLGRSSGVPAPQGASAGPQDKPHAGSH